MDPTTTGDEPRGSYWRSLLLFICQILALTSELLHLNHFSWGLLRQFWFWRYSQPLEGPWETLGFEYCQWERLDAFRSNTVESTANFNMRMELPQQNRLPFLWPSNFIMIKRKSSYSHVTLQTGIAFLFQRSISVHLNSVLCWDCTSQFFLLNLRL